MCKCYIVSKAVCGQDPSMFKYTLLSLSYLIFLSLTYLQLTRTSPGLSSHLRVQCTAVEPDSADLSIIRKRGWALSLESTDQRVSCKHILQSQGLMNSLHTWTGHEAGPDIVIDPDHVSSSVQVCSIVTDEAHSVTAGIIWGREKYISCFENIPHLPTHIPW